MTTTLLPRSRRLAAALAVLALPIAGCGSSDTGGDGSADPAASLPAATAFYAEATLRPEGDLKADVESVSKKIFRTEDPGKELDKLLKNLDDEKDGVSYEQDVKPWLGKKAGVAVTGVTADGKDPEFAIAVASRDNEKAETFINELPRAKKASYKGVDYRYEAAEDMAAALVGDTVILATKKAFEASIDATKGDALTDNANFKASREASGDDAVGFAYVDPKTILDLFAADPDFADPAAIAALRSALGGSGVKSVGAALKVAADALRIETATIGGKGDPSSGEAAEVTAALPAGSLLAAGLGDVGKTIESSLEQLASAGGVGGVSVDTLLQQVKSQTGLDLRRDVLSWMGSAGIFVRGQGITDFGGALVVNSKDEAASKRFVGKLADLLEQAGVAARKAGDRVIVEIPGAPSDVIIVSEGGKFVVAFGDSALEEALKPSARLGDDEAFKKAGGLLDGIEPSFYLDFPRILTLVAPFAGGSPEFQKAKPYLDAFGPLVAGSKRDGAISRGQLGIGVK